MKNKRILFTVALNLNLQNNRYLQAKNSMFVNELGIIKLLVDDASPEVLIKEAEKTTKE